MPRETVQGDDHDGTEVKIGWNKDQGVQIGVGAVGQFEFKEPLPAGVTVSGPYDDLWVSLTRHGCNELIRKLRRARDAAFGRDE